MPRGRRGHERTVAKILDSSGNIAVAVGRKTPHDGMAPIGVITLKQEGISPLHLGVVEIAAEVDRS